MNNWQTVEQAVKANGGVIETHEAIKARERPHWYDEVGAPAAQAAFFGGLIFGGVAALFVIGSGVSFAWRLAGGVAATAAIGAGDAGLIMAAYQLTVYRSMLTRWQTARIEPREVEQDGRGRILTEREPGRWTLARCSAPIDWIRLLARQSEGDPDEPRQHEGGISDHRRTG